MGGIGKTTLARNIHDDALIVYEFPFRGWVTVSQDYDAVTILESIVKSLGIALPDELIGSDDNEREKRLKECLHKHLVGRKFFIAVDDVWNTEVCDFIKHILPNEHTKSRILLTTRLTDVAEFTATIDFHHTIQFLNEEESWTLLQQKVFAEETCPDEFVHIGKYLASQCHGLPLAIVVIGGALSNNRTLRHWLKIVSDVGSVLNKGDESLSRILSLSYHHLPPQLKACFLHMGSFPKGYEINISRLIKLWIAEGFLKLVSKSKNLEKVGEGCIDDLVKRNLVVITKKGANGQFKYCAIHDHLRDFCRLRGFHEHFFTDRKEHFSTKRGKERRLTMDTIFHDKPLAFADGKYVRSICLFSKNSDTSVRRLDLGTVKVLKVLDIADLEVAVTQFSASLVTSLKYLALRSGSITKTCLLKSLPMFQNLQTLIIFVADNKRLSLSSEIWTMTRLRHLIVNRLELPPVSNPLPKLELQTLETVEDFMLTKEVILKAPSLRKMKMYTRGNDVNSIWKKYSLKNLVYLLQLKKLNITVYGSKLAGALPSWSSFVFPHNIEKLSIRGSKLPWEALRQLGSLKHLQVLRISFNAFMGELWEPVLGEFLELRFLLLEELDLKEWRAEKEHFPKLENLKIEKCRALKEIPDDIGEIGGLKSITVYGSKLAGASALKIQEYQRDELGYEGLQVIVRD